MFGRLNNQYHPLRRALSRMAKTVLAKHNTSRRDLGPMSEGITCPGVANKGGNAPKYEITVAFRPPTCSQR